MLKFNACWRSFTVDGIWIFKTLCSFRSALFGSLGSSSSVNHIQQRLHTDIACYSKSLVLLSWNKEVMREVLRLMCLWYEMRKKSTLYLFEVMNEVRNYLELLILLWHKRWTVGRFKWHSKWEWCPCRKHVWELFDRLRRNNRRPVKDLTRCRDQKRFLKLKKSSVGRFGYNLRIPDHP